MFPELPLFRDAHKDLDATVWFGIFGPAHMPPARKQYSSTGAMTVNIVELIEFASRIYTLQPGDVLLTGTPEGVGEVEPGDVITCSIRGIGEMTLPVRLHPAHAAR
jgi:2-keto-4-pentenoate hydratase/2-oxohepta-3-ene-1,7-dioic acid hydratase in catechol pathway